MTFFYQNQEEGRIHKKKPMGFFIFTWDQTQRFHRSYRTYMIQEGEYVFTDTYIINKATLLAIHTYRLLAHQSRIKNYITTL